jgi:DNA primase
VPGRIRDADIAEVRDRARIDQVVGEYVSLRNAGGGSMKGLCPFHDERSPSFHVTPARGLWYCFGCGEGGDVISFLERIEHVTFAEAVERLADRVGVQLAYDDAGTRSARGPQREQRTRMMEAHKAAAEFYADQLAEPSAVAARQFLDERGFDRAAAEHFGVGFSPRTGDALRRHLLAKGFSDDDLVTGGLVATGQRGACSTTTASTPSTSTPPRPRCTARATCSTASTWPRRRSHASREQSSSRATPT